MDYTGNHMFHYTKFESALRIIASKTIRFGDFRNMNDIAEAYREVFGLASDSVINKVLEEYQAISFTRDNPIKRGFAIDSLWGHYAQKGNGVCLVFNKKKIQNILNNKLGGNAKMYKIRYVSNYVGTLFIDGNKEHEVRQYIKDHIKNIFFTKSNDWSYEKEIRIIKTKKYDSNPFSLYYEDSLIAAILCLPKIENFNEYKKTSEFLMLKAVLPDSPILRYTTWLGKKELFDEQGKMLFEYKNK